MAVQPGRYLEGRFYMAWAALVMLLAFWGGIVVHDRGQADDAASGSSTAATSGGVSEQPQVHTRTRGS